MTEGLLVVVAHPDDESFGCGSVLAQAAASGVPAVVCCATRGEAGECRPEVDFGVDDLGAVREQELREAAAVLGVGRVIVLDHLDSGLAGEPPPGALVDVDAGDLVAEIRAVIDDVHPDVALDASDGHRDHVAVRDATVTAVGVADHQPYRTYLSALPRSAMARWVEHLRVTGESADYTVLGELGTPDEAVTTVVDVRRHLDRRWEAIRAHRSQVSPYEGLPVLADVFLATDRLIRVVPPWAGGPVETELFPESAKK